MREISIKLCPTSWFLFFWSRFCYRNHSKEEVKTEDVTRYESDATPEEIIERVPLRKQEFVLDRLSNTDIAGTQDAVLMVSFVWSYSFFVCVICLPHCNDCEAIWSAFSEDLREKKRILDTRYLVCLTFLFRGKVRISSSPRTWYEGSLMAVSRLSNYLCGKACADTSCSIFQAVCHPSCTT